MPELYFIKNSAMKAINNFFVNQSRIILFVMTCAVVCSILFTPGVSFAGERIPSVKHRDTTVAGEIRLQLEALDSNSTLHYPISVYYFYAQHAFQPAWIRAQQDTRQTWEALLLMNCVLQFGLCHEDYHPQELAYDGLHRVLDHPAQVNNNEKARYDIIITDALITLMNHLHYGKLNPEFSANKIDAGLAGDFCAPAVLTGAIGDTSFLKRIVSVQPNAKAYKDLQKNMQQITQFEEDCEGMPSEPVRKMAINLERLRWNNPQEKPYLQINIPSYTLDLVEPDTTYRFRVVVGKAGTPTPTLNSMLTDFTTASELKIPQTQAGRSETFLPAKNPKGVIYFWFKNNHGICIQGRPEKYLFNKEERALTNSGIGVEQGEKLAELLLEPYGAKDQIKDLHEAVSDYVIHDFVLHKPVPINIIYRTCEMVKGEFFDYKDIYNLDSNLEMALYNRNVLPVKIRKSASALLGDRH
jgi:murein L,D-transpeptidase YcbB/YkuD